MNALLWFMIGMFVMFIVLQPDKLGEIMSWGGQELSNMKGYEFNAIK